MCVCVCVCPYIIIDWNVITNLVIFSITDLMMYHFDCFWTGYFIILKEENVLFNDVLNTFYLLLYGVGLSFWNH